MFIFWFSTVILVLLASAFIIPPIWIATVPAEFAIKKQFVYSSLLALSLVSFSYFLYLKLGFAPQITALNNVEQQRNYVKIRPLYTRIQRELVKDQLDLKLDLENVDLILSFAQIHSQAQEGLLQPEIQRLLHAVLKIVPQQVTALNLLAINAYKTEDYAQAITYWQSVLQQFTPELKSSNLNTILQNKIASTKSKLAKQTSSQNAKVN